MGPCLGHVQFCTVISMPNTLQHKEENHGKFIAAFFQAGLVYGKNVGIELGRGPDLY